MAAILLLASVCMVFADEEAVSLIAPAHAGLPFSASTMEGAPLENAEKSEAAYTYTDWNGKASPVDLYTISIPEGTSFIKLSFDSEKLCYNYAFTGDGAPSVTDADYLSGAVADENTQDGRVTFTVPVDSPLVNYDGTTVPADGIIDFVQIQTPYDSDWNTAVLYAITFNFDGYTADAAETVFSDVPADAEYAAAIKWAAEQGITDGIGGGRFGTGMPVTRAQLATFVWKLAGRPESNTAVETVFYNDVTAGQYYTAAIDWAYRSGLIDGVEPHTFGVTLSAERREIVSILAGYTGRTAEEIGAFIPAGSKREDVVMAIYNLTK